MPQLVLLEVLQEQQRGEARSVQQRAEASDRDSLPQRLDAGFHVRSEEAVGPTEEGFRRLVTFEPALTYLALPLFFVETLGGQQHLDDPIDHIDCGEVSIRTLTKSVFGIFVTALFNAALCDESSEDSPGACAIHTINKALNHSLLADIRRTDAAEPLFPRLLIQELGVGVH